MSERLEHVTTAGQAQEIAKRRFRSVVADPRRECPSSVVEVNFDGADHLHRRQKDMHRLFMRGDPRVEWDEQLGAYLVRPGWYVLRHRGLEHLPVAEGHAALDGQFIAGPFPNVGKAVARADAERWIRAGRVENVMVLVSSLIMGSILVGLYWLLSWLL